MFLYVRQCTHQTQTTTCMAKKHYKGREVKNKKTQCCCYIEYFNKYSIISNKQERPNILAWYGYTQIVFLFQTFSIHVAVKKFGDNLDTLYWFDDLTD